jgi:hypothetical protein
MFLIISKEEITNKGDIRMIRIEGLTKRQLKIADLIWACSTFEETEDIVQKIGREADVIRELVLLGAIDKRVEMQTDFSKIQKLLSTIG